MEASIGHNSGEDGPVLRLAKDQLTSIVERIERLDADIKELRSDQKDIYAEAKGNGYDVKVLRRVIALRKQDPAARAEQETILETYMQALNMV